MSHSLFLLSSARSVLVVLGAMLLALALVVAASALDPKKADADRVVTKTFNKPAAILIPAGAIPGSEADCLTGPTEGIAGPYPSNRSISAFPSDSTTVDVNLVLKKFQHTWIDDVDVLLSKGLRNRTVMSDVGGGTDINGITLTLDDEATTLLPNEEALITGRFKPTNISGAEFSSDEDSFPGVVSIDPSSELSGFDGLKPNGKWQLRLSDDGPGDCGQLASGWSLIIKARV
jgi:hypothetical protein